MEIDLGTKALKENFVSADQEELTSSLITTFTRKINDIFAGVVIKGQPVVCNSDGELKGKWKNGPMHTVTHQSVLLGIPAMQFEFPRSIRTLIMGNEGYIRALASAILSTY